MGLPSNCGAKRPSPFVKYVSEAQEFETTTSTTSTTPGPYDYLLPYIKIPQSGISYIPINEDDVDLTPVDSIVELSGCELFSYSNSSSPLFYVSYQKCDEGVSKIYREISRRPIYFDSLHLPVSICVSGYKPSLIDLEDYNSKQTNIGDCEPIDYNSLSKIDSYAERELINNTCIPDYLDTDKFGHNWVIEFKVNRYDSFHEENPTSDILLYQWDYYEIDGSLSNNGCITYDTEKYSNIDQNSKSWKRLATTAYNRIRIHGQGFGIPVYSTRIKTPAEGEEDTDQNLEHKLYAIRCIVYRNIYTQEPKPFLIVTNFFTENIICSCLQDGYYCWVNSVDDQDRVCSNMDLRPDYSIVSGPYVELSECESSCDLTPPTTGPPIY